MKLNRIQTQTAVALLFAAASIIPAFGQEHGEDRGHDGAGRAAEQHRAPAQKGRPEEQRRAPAPQARPDQHAAPAARNQAEHRPGPAGNAVRGGNSFQRFSSHNWKNDHRSWAQRGGYHGYRIPESRFRVSFGRQHYFHIGNPVFFNGRPGFRYGGYSFILADPWPDYWGPSWYDSDDVYVDYNNDGYYLYNHRYPGVGIALSVNF